MRAKPGWMQATMKNSANLQDLQELVRGLKLHTVCEEARCPNLFECWSERTATFMILGKTCTRACRFCAVQTGFQVLYSIC